MENTEFLKRIKELHESHTEKLLELIYEIVTKTELSDLNEDYDKKKISQKGIVIIDFLNKETNTFSMNRMNIKNALQHCI